LQYFEDNLDEELYEVLKSSHEVNNGSLIKMRFLKVNDYWVNKEDDSDGASARSSATAGPSVSVGPSTRIDEFYNMQALVAYESLVDHGIPMSRFERLMINRMDTMANDQKEHYEFCAARFQHLDKQIEAVQTQLGEFQYGRKI